MMADIMIQTAVLVVAILAVQKLFGDRLHAYLRYSLWLLVVLRLMVPFNFLDSPLSVLRVAGAAGGREERLMQRSAAEDRAAFNGQDTGSNDAAAHIITDHAAADADGKKNSVRQTDRFGSIAEMSGRVLPVVWLAGSVLVGGVLLFSHGRFQRRLRRSRTRCTGGARDAAKNCHIPVYRVKGLETPCLAGVFRPAVYVGAELDKDSDYFRYAVTHEKVHCLHGDHLWALVRAALVTAYWFHPLVWIAAIYSAKDGEIACDYGTIRRLGQDERTAYSEMLLAFAKGKRSRRCDPCGTMLRPRRSELKERIQRLVKGNRSAKAWAGTLAVSLMLVTAGCTFTGASADEAEETVRPVEAIQAETSAEEKQAETERGSGDVSEDPIKEPAADEEPGTEGEAPQEEADAEADNVNTEEAGALAAGGEILYAEPCEYTGISAAFGERINPATQEVIRHEGIDYAAEKGTDVKAAADGVVYETGFSAQDGNYVVLLHANGDMTYYCHCQEITARKDEEVKCGDKIATVGQTGMATGPHLHFALSRNGEFIDPQAVQEQKEADVTYTDTP